MEQKTHIANMLESSNCKEQYDTQVKQILSDKTILAWILKYTTSEFKRYPIELIKTCIEGNPEVGTHRVFPSLAPEMQDSRGILMPEVITGMDTVDKVPGEGEITYDVRFYVITPTRECIKLIINVEGQKSFYPGYDLVTRGVFYCARMLSAQKNTEFTKDNYGIETTVELEGGLREMCNLSDLIEERGIEKGIEKGIEQGIEQGDRMRLHTQIQKKLAKGKSLEQIADELEETVEVILPLYEQVLQEAN